MRLIRLTQTSRVGRARIQVEAVRMGNCQILRFVKPTVAGRFGECGGEGVEGGDGGGEDGKVREW